MASQNRIGDHASNLVNSLAQLRERTETEDRPIVFVTHSLGGLVFEDAMLLSTNSAEKHIRNLVKRTNGVCFLGTPHCGAATATWASIFGSLTNVLKTTNVDILDVLRSNSEVLSRIQSQFHTMLRANKDQGREMKITCFFEELPVRGVGEVSLRWEGSGLVCVANTLADCSEVLVDSAWVQLYGDPCEPHGYDQVRQQRRPRVF